MKKIFVGLFALLMAVATVFTVQANEKARVDDPVYYWFDESGHYLGQFTLSSQQSVCNANTTIVCRTAYEAIDMDEDGNEIPSGPVATTLKKLN